MARHLLIPEECSEIQKRVLRGRVACRAVWCMATAMCSSIFQSIPTTLNAARCACHTVERTLMKLARSLEWRDFVSMALAPPNWNNSD